MRPLPILTVAASLYVSAGAALPFSATHLLDGGCHWHPDKLWSPHGALRSDPSPADDAGRLACLYRRGMKEQPQLVAVIVSTWPTEAEFAAMGVAR